MTHANVVARIRRAVPNDAATLTSFAARTFVATFGPANTADDVALHLSRSFSEEQQRKELLDPNYTTLFIEVDGVIAGYVEIRRGDAPAGVDARTSVEILRFYIDSPWHGQGLAQQLMSAAKEAARDMGAAYVWLSVWEKNPRGIAFYKKSGFRDVGATTFVLGRDVQSDRVMMAELP